MDAYNKGLSSEQVAQVRDTIKWDADKTYTSREFRNMDDAVKAYSQMNDEQKEIVSFGMNYVNALVKASKYNVNAERYFGYRSLFADAEYENGKYDDLKNGEKYMIVAKNSSPFNRDDDMRAFILCTTNSGKSVGKYDKIRETKKDNGKFFTAEDYAKAYTAKNNAASQSKKNIIKSLVSAGFSQSEAAKLYNCFK